MRFIDYDKLHYTIGKILLEYTPPTLRNEYGRGYAEGLHRALYEIECQEKFTYWDNRKKLLQPERSEFDWSIVNAMLESQRICILCGSAMKEKDAPETIDEVKKEICDHYCKWPEQFGDEGFKEMLEAKCSECPLNRL